MGGILSGQALIRASELRSITNDISKYATTIYAFRDRYFSLPGDFNKASTFYGTSCVDKTNNSCNGNSDGVVFYDATCTTANSLEMFRAWQHLAYAGLVEGDYSYVSNNCAGNYVNAQPGLNVPKSRINKAGIIYRTCTDSFCNDYQNKQVFVIGAQYANFLESGFLSPDEGWNMDQKLDDGKSATGKLRGFNGHTALSQTNCIASSDYNLASTDKHCRFYYILN